MTHQTIFSADRWRRKIFEWRRGWRMGGRALVQTTLRTWFGLAWLPALLLALTILFALPIYEPLYVGGIFTSPSSLVTLLSAIAGTLAAILGITIAVVLVALEILRATYAAIAPREVFRTSTFRQLLCLYLYTIGLALFVSVWVGTTVPAFAVALSYLTGLLTFLCLCVLYPALKHILTSARVNYARLDELASDIGWRGKSRHDRRRVSPDELENLEHDSLYVLSEIAIRAFADRDRVIPRMALGAVANRLLALLKEEIDSGTQPEQVRHLFQLFLPFFRTFQKSAIEHRDEMAIERLLGVIEQVHENAAKGKLRWHALIEFNEMLQELATRCVEHGLRSNAKGALRTIEQIFDAHLTHNVPAEKDIWMLNWKDGQKNTEADYDASNQWDDVQRRYLAMLAAIVELSLDHPAGDVSTDGLMRLSTIMGTVERLVNLGPAQKNQIIRMCVFESERIIGLTAEKRPANALLMIYPLNSMHLHRWLDDDTRWSKTAILRLCSTLLRLAELKRLDGDYAMNELGTLARGCIEQINNGPRYAETVLLACDTFERLSTAYDPPQSLADVEVIRGIQEQLGSLVKWFEAKRRESPEVQTRLRAVIEAVNRIDIPTRYQRLENMTWPTISIVESAADKIEPT